VIEADSMVGYGEQEARRLVAEVRRSCWAVPAAVPSPDNAQVLRDLAREYRSLMLLSVARADQVSAKYHQIA
jgi:hypothetical protein